jgi:hypothetical protein
MPKKDHDTLLDNHGKSKFDEGKYKETNQIVKVALGDKAFDTQGMKREDVFAKINETLRLTWETENGKPPAEKEKQWNEEKTKLQKLVEEKENKLKELSGKLDETVTAAQKRERVLSAVSAINFEATGEILSMQRDVVLKNIISSYELKVEDGKDVWYKGGVKQVDSLQNPLSIDEIANGVAIIFPTSTASNGRGDNSSNNNNHQSGNLDADLKKATDEVALHKILEARGLSPISNEGRAVIRKWTELHKKSA